MDNPKPITNLDMVISDMADKAGDAATRAWAEALKKGYAGSIKLPVDPAARKYAQMFFTTGYGMALIDYTMEASKRLKAASELDQEQSLKKLVV